MNKALESFYEFLDRPLYGWTRIVLALLVIPLVLSFMVPLWKIELVAPQYPRGLYMEIYSYKLAGGNHGQHIDEINNLNHYIGMRSIDQVALADLDWIPLALGAIIILTLRVAAIGNVRSMLDLIVITSYVGLFSLSRFAYRLYVFGHNLDPKAPIQIEPFMPPLLGSKQIANFEATSLPEMGTKLIVIFGVSLAALLAYHLIRGRIEHRQSEAK